MTLAEVATNAQGEVVLDYQLRIGGRNQFIARFYGDAQRRPAEGKVMVLTTGQAQLAQRAAGIPLPPVGPLVLILVLGVVWSVYLGAMLAVAGIAREGAREGAGATVQAIADSVPVGATGG